MPPGFLFRTAVSPPGDTRPSRGGYRALYIGRSGIPATPGVDRQQLLEPIVGLRVLGDRFEAEAHQRDDHSVVGRTATETTLALTTVAVAVPVVAAVLELVLDRLVPLDVLAPNLAVGGFDDPLAA